MRKRRGTQRHRSPTSESATFGHGQTATKVLSQPKCVSQQLPKKREKNKKSRDRTVVFSPPFLPRSKQKRHGAQPSHQLGRSLQQLCQEFRFISGITLMGY